MRAGLPLAALLAWTSSSQALEPKQNPSDSAEGCRAERCFALRWSRSPNPGALFGISLLRHQQRIMVRHQLPSMLPLYPYSGEAIVTGNGFASVLPNHG